MSPRKGFVQAPHILLALIFASFLPFLFCGCASYQLGEGQRSLPGGYDEVAIPMFKNKSMETGIEVDFTNALIEEFEKSKVAKVTSRGQAQVTLLGTIDSVSYVPTGTINSTTDPYLESSASLTSSYRILITMSLKLVRNSDNKLLWKSNFQSERSYLAPLVTVDEINSVDPLYNQSARDIDIAKMAKDMMWEAHNRITENF